MAIYRIELTVQQMHTAYVHAESQEEAQEKAEAIYAHDAGALATEWGADELDSSLTAAPEPLSATASEADYRGDPRKLADENEDAYNDAREEEGESEA